MSAVRPGSRGIPAEMCAEKGRAKVSKRAVALLLLLAVLALAVPVALASKGGIAVIGGPAAGEPGGLFNNPRGVAINQSGAGGVPAGTTYVADSSNHRIQQLSPSGSFVRAFGQDVIVNAGLPANSNGVGYEVCDTTTVPANTAAECKIGITTAQTGGALNTPQDVAVDQSDGSVYVADQANRRIQKFTATGAFVWAAGWDVVSAGPGNDVTGTANQFETCVAANGDTCKAAAAAGANAGQLAAAAAGIAVNPTNGRVIVADTTNRRLQMLSSGGAFVAVVGYDVVPAGKPGDTGVQLESCPVTAAQETGGCQAGQTTAPGNEPGQFPANQPTAVATDSGGAIYAVTSAVGVNGRVQRFTPSGSAASVFAPAVLSGNPTPSRIAVDQFNDRVYVVKGTTGVLELDSFGNLLDTHGADLPAATGLAARNAGGNLYYAEIGADRVIVLGAAVAPTASLDDVTVFASTTATFSGLVNPQGLNTSYRFEYRSDFSSTWLSLPATAVGVGGGSVDVPVSQNATGLEPNTLHHVRLVATKDFGGGSVVTAAKIFTTAPAPPVVSDLSHYELDDTSARLVVRVDPSSMPATYVFQYGTQGPCDANPCASTPPASVGAGHDPVLVSQAISGLSPDTEYHYRAVASNAVGDAPSAGQTFRTRAEPPPLPDGRSYEMVTPADKNFGEAASGATEQRYSVAPNGDGVSFVTGAQFGDPPAQLTASGTDYASRRGPAGWETAALNPLYCNGDFEVSPPVWAFPSSLTMTSPQIDAATFLQPEGGSCSLPLLDPAAPNPSFNLYRRDLSGSAGFNLLTPSPSFTPGFAGITGVTRNSSDDFSRIVYMSTGNQTAPPDSPAPADIRKLYEWHEGSLRLASVAPNGVPLTTDSDSISADGVGGTSADGARILFHNPVATATGSCAAAACELYMREGGTATHWVSEQECDPACSNVAGADVFRFATDDDSKVLFTSVAKLTDEPASSDCAGNLYLYTHGANPAAEENLRLLSKDNEPADNAVGSPNMCFEGVIGMSEDAETVFFASRGQIVPGAPTAAGFKVYRWQWAGGSPTVDYLATLPVNRQERRAWQFSDALTIFNPRPMNRQVTPDGRYLLLQTAVALDPIADRDSGRDVYRWDEDGGWACASCQLPGAASMGHSRIDATYQISQNGGHSGTHNDELRILISDDGERIFFTSPDPLVDGDVNGDEGCPLQINETYSCDDVYEWHDGAVDLISGGVSTSASILVGASESGRDVFFITHDRLVGWDTDENSDLYDARIGGGFPEPPAEPPTCGSAESCRGPGTQPGDASAAGSASFQGPANPQPQLKAERRCPSGKRKVSRAGRTRCVARKAAKRADKRKRRAGADRGVGR